MIFTRLKPRCQKGCVFFLEVLEKDRFSCFIQLLEGACFSWLLVPSSIFRSLSDFLPSSSTWKDSGDDIGTTRVIFSYPGQHISYCIPMCNHNSLFPCNSNVLMILEIKSWTWSFGSWGGYYSVFPRREKSMAYVRSWKEIQHDWKLSPQEAMTGKGAEERSHENMIEFYSKENEEPLRSEIIRFELLKISSTCTWRLLTDNTCLLHWL